DDHRVERKARMGQLRQGFVQSGGVLDATETAAGDRRRIVDLPGDEPSVDVHLTEVVDHYADARPGLTQQVIEEGGLASAEVSGQGDHRHGVALLSHPTHLSVVGADHRAPTFTSQRSTSRCLRRCTTLRCGCAAAVAGTRSRYLW